ncbi:MAG: hypothetical protein MUE72_05125 [Chitinophagaceae bacterium]|nr:hypothetical protein [Chitinophagaceae bacterium]MCU0382952.1 hypothetical protein [Cyclobacteriaceae bacterium]
MKIKSIYVFFVFITLFISCEISNPPIKETPHEIKGVQLLNDQRILTKVLSKDEPEYAHINNKNLWKSIPESVSTRIIEGESPLLTKFKHSPVSVISYKLKTNDNYETLIIYFYKGNTISAIAHSKNIGEFTSLSLTDLNGEVYFEFLVNKENKLGRFQAKKDLQYSALGLNSSIASVREVPIESDDQTCPQKYSDFTSCLKCAVNECANDWLCAVVCALKSGECLSGFSLACIFG